MNGTNVSLLPVFEIVFVRFGVIILEYRPFTVRRRSRYAFSNPAALLYSLW
jgi:hypothetical protein